MKFSEMPYQRLDIDALKKEMEEMVARLKEAKDYPEARELFMKNEEIEKRVMTQSTMAQIEQDHGKIRGELGTLERHQLRIIPELHFHLDETIDRMERIDELLKS